MSDQMVEVELGYKVWTGAAGDTDTNNPANWKQAAEMQRIPMKTAIDQPDAVDEPIIREGH